MLGADHHGYIGRLRAMAACAGDDPDRNLEILIGQLVNLVRDGEPVRMSKRAGTSITLDELVDAVGVDAGPVRAGPLLGRLADRPRPRLWITRHANDNPVYYVQYAHARIASLLRNAAELGIDRGDDFDPALLDHEREGDLLRALGEFPRVVATAAELREPHRDRPLPRGAGRRLPPVLRRLPGAAARATSRSTDADRARLWLVEATRDRAGQRAGAARRLRARADVGADARA